MRDELIPLVLEREAGMPDTVPQVAVGFGFMPKKDEKTTQEAGRPMFKEVEFFRCVVPGDKNSEYLQPAKDTDRERFPAAYRRFKDRNTTPIEGTPIEEWAAITRSEALGLKAINIHTLEMLGGLGEAQISKMGYGARELVNKAKAAIAQAKDTAAAQKLAEEGVKKDQQIAELQRQINDLAARLDGKGRKAA